MFVFFEPGWEYVEVKSFLRAFYRPYRWIVVIPFMVISTFFHGSACILSGLIFGPGRGNIFAVSWARSACHIASIRVRILDRLMENIRVGIARPL